jgi:hypothetical protein
VLDRYPVIEERLAAKSHYPRSTFLCRLEE